MWVVCSGEVRGEVGARSRMCCVGWVVWVRGFYYYMLCLGYYSGSTVSSYVCRELCVHIPLAYNYTVYNFI